MLTGYVFCIPLKTKTATEVVQAYIDNVYAKFGGSLWILSDNGMEFKNQIFSRAHGLNSKVLKSFLMFSCVSTACTVFFTFPATPVHQTIQNGHHVVKPVVLQKNIVEILYI